MIVGGIYIKKDIVTSGVIYQSYHYYCSSYVWYRVCCNMRLVIHLLLELWSCSWNIGEVVEFKIQIKDFVMWIQIESQMIIGVV